MGFDTNNPQPLVQPRRWGTKVNISMIVGVIAFFAMGLAAIYWMHAHPNKSAAEPPAPTVAQP